MTPRIITDCIEKSLGIQGVPIKLKVIIEHQLIEKFKLPKIQAAERAEQLAPSIARLIVERSSKAEAVGTSPTLALIGTTADVVSGFCFVLNEDSDQLVALKKQRAHLEDLLKKIKSLSFSEFETFGKKVLYELGAGKADVTTHSNDQGIDFFGHFDIGHLHGFPKGFFNLAHDVRFLILGQAKHYPNSSLSTGVVRELIGAISLARTKTFSTDGLDIFKDLEIRPFSPVVALLLTTGTISSGAQFLAQSSGIIAKNGEQLANFLADRGVGMKMSSGQLVFSIDLFDNWLKS